ncbi:hypothetical protein [Dactylosporangium sp. CA-139066]|uniref:hypothetical protein n=1 Tax=Dactylosporangium sp. CA-139066 TaxID=3239930 RepID=UPI003D8DA24A
MERSDVVIRLPQPGQERPRIAVILVGGRSPLRVRWEDDGVEEDVVLDSRHKLAARGSLRYSWLLDPATVGDKIRSDPAWAIIRSIEDGLRLDARGHQELLGTYGIGLAVANAAWLEARKRLMKRDDIVMDRKRRYIWKPPTSAVPLAEPAEPEPIIPPEAQSEDSSAGARVADTQSAEAVQAVPEGGGLPDLADLLRGAAQTPLRSGMTLGRLSDTDLGNLLGELGEDQLAGGAALLVAVPRHLPELHPLGPEHVTVAADDALLRAAAGEVEAVAGDADLHAAAVWMLRRLSAEVLTPVAVGPLGRVLRVVAPGAEPTDLHAGLQLLAKLLSMANLAEASTAPSEAIADAASALPLRPGNGRAAVIAAVARLWPDRVAEAMWWRGASLTDVVACADGGLGSVTSLKAVGERVIRPLVKAELDAAGTRRGLSLLLGLPAEFARQLPDDAVAAMFRRIGRDDPTVRGWVDALADTEGADALRRELDEARTAVEAAMVRADAGEREAADLRGRAERLEEMLRGQHEEAVGLRAAQERQVRIDVVRAMADLAAEVEELAADHAGSDVLVDRVRAIAAGSGLEPIGVAGADTAFDPAVHKPIAGRPAPGSQVSVIRPGYRWRTADDVVLMSKASVLGQ